MELKYLSKVQNYAIGNILETIVINFSTLSPYQQLYLTRESIMVINIIENCKKLYISLKNIIIFKLI